MKTTNTLRGASAIKVATVAAIAAIGLALTACADPNALPTSGLSPTIEPSETSTPTVLPTDTTTTTAYTPATTETTPPPTTETTTSAPSQTSAWLATLTQVSVDFPSGVYTASAPFTFRGATITDTNSIGAEFGRYSNSMQAQITYALGASWKTVRATLCIPDDSRSRSAGMVKFYDANDPARGALFTSNKLLPGQSQDFEFSVTDIIQMTVVYSWEDQNKGANMVPVFVFLTNATVIR